MTGIIVSSPPTIELPPGSASSNPQTLPPVNYQYAVTGIPQTWTAKQTFPLGNISLFAADVFGLAASSTVDTTNADNITGGSQTGTGAMVRAISPSITGSLTVTSSSANALTVGLAGATNPAFKVDASTALSATGISVTSQPAAGGVALGVISSGNNEGLAINAKGSGPITIGNVSTGNIVLSRALTYGGVALSNSVTGTGSMALSTSPALTTPAIGDATGNSLTLNGATAAGAGQIWGTINLNGTASWQFRNTNAGSAASALVTIGNDLGTGDFTAWSSTFPGIFTNRIGIVVGSNNAGMLLTTVGAGHTIDLAVNNVKVASAVTGGLKTFVAGSAATPSVTVNTDGYGMYQPSANQLGITVAGGVIWDYGITNANQHFMGGTVIGGFRILANFPTGGIGYTTGAGSTITQGSGSGKATGVTLNNVTGKITTDTALLAANAVVSFVFTNSSITATDLLFLQHVSGGTIAAYNLGARVTNGSATIDIRNVSAGSLSEAFSFRFYVMKGSDT